MHRRVEMRDRVERARTNSGCDTPRAGDGSAEGGRLTEGDSTADSNRSAMLIASDDDAS